MMNPAAQAQYRAQAHMAQRPTHPSARRGMMPITSGSNMHPNGGASQVQQQRMLAEAHKADVELAKRKAKRPTDKNMPEGVEDIIIGDGVQQYKSLRDVERRLDAVMMRKRLELSESRFQATDRSQRLRIWISNTVENQPWQGRDLDENAFDFSTGQEATYKVKIEGRLLDDEPSDIDRDEDDEEEEDKDKDKPQTEMPEKDTDAMDTDTTDQATKKTTPAQRPRPFSSFFKGITVEYDRPKNLQPDATTSIEWKKPVVSPHVTDLPPSIEFDFLEFERKSDENINCTINLYRDETPQRYTLSPDLADIIGEKEATREQVLTGMWEYIKAMGLQQEEEKRNFHCDEALKKVFGTDACAFPLINERVIPHLLPVAPIRLPYTIRVDPDYQAHGTPTVYDVFVPVENPVHKRLMAMRQDPSFHLMLQQITNLDSQAALIVQAINHSKSKHSFLTGMSKDPANFIKKWTSSQKHDLDVILGELPRGSGDVLEEEFRRGGPDGVWGSDNVRESVALLAAKPSAFAR